MIPLYDRVAVIRDLPEHGLRQGDVATLLDRVPHPHAGDGGVILEIFDATGRSLKTVVVRESDVAPLHEGDILSVRPLSGVG
jgi:hypothetical protein